MANYHARIRSNYFKVKDADAFAAFCNRLDLEIIRDERDPTRYGFMGDSDQGAPTGYYDPETDQFVEVDFFNELADHLVPGEVAVYQEIGYEKFCFLSGYAVAVNSEGETRTVDIDDIYDLAKELTDKPVTVCRY